MSAAKHTVAFISLGCPKNLVDSEQLVSTLVSRGFRVLTDPAQADVVVVNTCGFLEASRAESLGVIRDAVRLKQRSARSVLVAGCMVGNYRELLEREAPGVDRYVPFSDYGKIADVAADVCGDAPPVGFTVERLRADVALTPAHYAYLKISEGCNHTCSFCVIPDIRGAMRSLPIEDLVQRARVLAARGVRELVLVAQDSTVYGTDIYGENRLVKLIERLRSVEGLAWIRLMYAYPTEVRPALAEVLAAGGSVLPYLDVPIQHSNDRVLKLMRRGYGRRDLETMVQLLRGRGIALRTTVITGFPGESDADFEDLLQFLRDARFERLGAFPYSREHGSRADALEGHLPEAVKKERLERLMLLQQDIAFEEARRQVGRDLEVLLDTPSRDGAPAVGRTRSDAPEVDACVRIADTTLRAGEIVTVNILAADGYDLTGTAPRRALEI
ncbi:MAG: 30S ribosomal protein S12 methylthiotransferase RimO [Planctomycetes bacterium]|nr:30S ribosomal protein S12 methylthiotransferase RimO [Planctomycetota bacterium]